MLALGIIGTIYNDYISPRGNKLVVLVYISRGDASIILNRV